MRRTGNVVGRTKAGTPEAEVVGMDEAVGTAFANRAYSSEAMRTGKPVRVAVTFTLRSAA